MTFIHNNSKTDKELLVANKDVKANVNPDEMLKDSIFRHRDSSVRQGGIDFLLALESSRKLYSKDLEKENEKKQQEERVKFSITPHVNFPDRILKTSTRFYTLLNQANEDFSKQDFLHKAHRLATSQDYKWPVYRELLNAIDKKEDSLAMPEITPKNEMQSIHERSIYEQDHIAASGPKPKLTNREEIISKQEQDLKTKLSNQKALREWYDQGIISKAVFKEHYFNRNTKNVKPITLAEVERKHAFYNPPTYKKDAKFLAEQEKIKRIPLETYQVRKGPGEIMTVAEAEKLAQKHHEQSGGKADPALSWFVNQVQAVNTILEIETKQLNEASSAGKDYVWGKGANNHSSFPKDVVSVAKQIMLERSNINDLDKIGKKVNVGLEYPIFNSFNKGDYKYSPYGLFGQHFVPKNETAANKLAKDIIKANEHNEEALLIDPSKKFLNNEISFKEYQNTVINMLEQYEAREIRKKKLTHEKGAKVTGQYKSLEELYPNKPKWQYKSNAPKKEQNLGGFLKKFDGTNPNTNIVEGRDTIKVLYNKSLEANGEKYNQRGVKNGVFYLKDKNQKWIKEKDIIGSDATYEQLVLDSFFANRPNATMSEKIRTKNVLFGNNYNKYGSVHDQLRKQSHGQWSKGSYEVDGKAYNYKYKIGTSVVHLANDGSFDVKMGKSKPITINGISYYS